MKKQNDGSANQTCEETCLHGWSGLLSWRLWMIERIRIWSDDGNVLSQILIYTSQIVLFWIFCVLLNGTVFMQLFFSFFCWQSMQLYDI